MISVNTFVFDFQLEIVFYINIEHVEGIIFAHFQCAFTLLNRSIFLLNEIQVFFMKYLTNMKVF